MDDRQRKRAFVGAALVLLVAAVLVTLREPGSVPRRDVNPAQAGTAIRTGRPPTSQPAEAEGRFTASPAATAPSASPSAAAATRNEREADRAPAVAPDKTAAAGDAARAFLAGYLRYSYGQATARTIRRATARLLRELGASPPRVPTAIARARPRLISVRAMAELGGRAVDVIGVVDDGTRRYSVPLELRETRGRWLVVAVGG